MIQSSFWPNFLFLFIAAVTLTGGENTLTKQMCECSKVKPEVNEAFEAKHASRHKRSTEAEGPEDRIVGGYAAENPKPWIAKLWLKKSEFLCGSTVINKRYLLTAGHCICKVLKCTAGKPDYVAKDELTAYLGVNKHPVKIDNADIKGNPLFEYGVESAIAHPEYKVSFDIALVKLDRDIVFVPDVLQPICLPTADDKSDVPSEDKPLEVYIAGWGKTSSDCVTNEFGPIKNLKCKLPFKYRDSENVECSNSRSPSSKIEECKNFQKVMKGEYPASPGTSVIITDGTKNTTCYSFDKGEHGWCQGVGTDDEFDDNWGWCEAGCKLKKDSERIASILQETRLEILPLGTCKDMITSGQYSFVGKNEICAGKKKKFKSIKIFKKEGENYTQAGNTTDYLGMNKDGKYAYDYYIAGTDSCAGDSGGPVYRWINDTATLIAVVARGFGSNNQDGCAELNYPGIYTRVAKFLDWIQENAKDGIC